jgi:pSer/pThr/pTyr-binding forkhead associated (FHA) protein
MHEDEEALPTMMQKPPIPTPAGKSRLAQGAPPKQCPNCMTLNAATFKFCARCGTPLGATAAPMQTTPAPMPKSAKAAAPAKPAAPRQPIVSPPAAKPPPAATATKPPQSRPAPPPPPKPVTGISKAPPPAKAPAPSRPRARVSAIARDGSRSADFVLVKDETRVGREVGDGDVKLDKDPFIAPLHAVFKFEGQQLVVLDSGTPNGVFLWLKERQLESGDELRIGRQRLRIEWMPEEAEQLADQPVWGSPNPGYSARVVQLLEGGGEGDVFPLKIGENMVGRGTGDVSFPQDGYVSSKHATITVNDGSLAVKDLGSANGTFVRINGHAPVNAGDLLLVGEQILRVDPA